MSRVAEERSSSLVNRKRSTAGGAVFTGAVNPKTKDWGEVFSPVIWESIVVVVRPWDWTIAPISAGTVALASNLNV